MQGHVAARSQLGKIGRCNQKKLKLAFYSLHNDRIRHPQMDDHVQGSALGVEGRVEETGLAQGAGVAVEDPALRGGWGMILLSAGEGLWGRRGRRGRCTLPCILSSSVSMILSMSSSDTKPINPASIISSRTSFTPPNPDKMYLQLLLLPQLPFPQRSSA